MRVSKTGRDGVRNGVCEEERRTENKAPGSGLSN